MLWPNYIHSYNIYKAKFQAQETVYNAKVQTVKDEHQQLLQEAFERAKVRFHGNRVIQLFLLCRMMQVTHTGKTYKHSERSLRRLPNNFALHIRPPLRVLKLNMKLNSPPRRKRSRSSCPVSHSS